MEGLKAAEGNLVVFIHPSKAKIVSEAITRELSSLLFKFNESFDGVLLAYEVVEIMSKQAKILSGLYPYLGVGLKANLLLFTPKENMLLEGKIVKLARESIHVVVLGFSAAIITEEDIRDEFKFKIRKGQELFRSRFHKRHVMKVGTYIRFLVKSFDREILHITGSLSPACTGSILWLDRSAKEDHVANRSAKRRKESVGWIDVEDNNDGQIDGETVSAKTDIVIKKSKRDRVDRVS